MNREQFDKLEILDQIKYINNKLENNKSITSVCKELEIGRSTIRDRFKKINYGYSKDLNKYVDNDSITDVLQELVEPHNSNDNRCITSYINKNNVSNTDVERVDKVTDIINKSDIEIKETIIDIVNNYDVLKEIIELHKSNMTVVKQQIVIDVEDADSKLVTLRVNSKELELFNSFCDDNKQYKKIDLISQALKEFRIKHS